jgi:crotonobetainyl-CoA:carnitine CoA-transferase CaiB-like acyl-CoA transferase
MFFAELGAEVIKIENATTGGDVTRNWKLPTENPHKKDSAYFNAVNWGKKSQFIDLQNDTERQKIEPILRGADIIVANFRPSSAKKLGLDYENLQRINPNVIYAQIVGYDENDERPAFDVVLQAETGFMFMSGERGRQAVKMPVALIDILAAHHLKEAILIALLHRVQTGKGSCCTVSLYDAAVASLANQATNWLVNGVVPQRIGAEHPNIAPYGDVFLTVDKREITLAVGNEKQFSGLCKIIGLLDLPIDNRFKNNQLRVINRQELVEILQEKIQYFERDHLLQLLRGGAIPAGAVLPMNEVFENSNAQKLILEDPETGAKCVKTAVFKLQLQ